MLSTPPRRGQALVSPLRFPGSKRRLIPFIKKTLALNGVAPRLYVEPFLGGASVALQLLSDGVVPFAALADRDPEIAAFWYSVFFDTDWMVDAILHAKVDIRHWRLHKASRPRSRRDRALRTFFLNRTSFSGIGAESGGPLGGKEGQSQYAIDCRFPRERLAQRVFRAGLLREKILWVRSLDWRESLAEAQSAIRGDTSEGLFAYLDPPFYYKADRLYAHFFTEPQHRALSRFLRSAKFTWLLSYDAAPPIVDLYSSNGGPIRLLTMRYSASPSVGLHRRKELIATNLPKLPARRPAQFRR